MFGFLRARRHDRLSELLSSYIDGQLSEDDTSRVEAHLCTCEECRRELETLRATVSLLRSLPEVEPTRSFALARAPEPERRGLPVGWGVRAAMSVAGLLLVVLLVGDAVGLVRQVSLGDIWDGAMDAQMDEVIREVPVEVVVEREVIKEVPVEIIVEKEVIKEVQVPGETVVVEKEVIREVEVPVEVVVEKEVVKEVPVERIVTQEVVKAAEVVREAPVEVAREEVVKELEVSSETAVVTKEAPVEAIAEAQPATEAIREAAAPAQAPTAVPEAAMQLATVAETSTPVAAGQAAEEAPTPTVVTEAVRETPETTAATQEVVREVAAPGVTALAEEGPSPSPLADPSPELMQADVPDARDEAPSQPAGAPGDPGTVVPVPTTTPPGVEAVTERRADPTPVAATQPVPEPTVRPSDRESGLALPLWQLQLAAGAVFLVLLAGTLWTARRRRVP